MEVRARNSRTLWRQGVVANAHGELLGRETVAVGGFTLAVHGGQPTGALAGVGCAGRMIILGAFAGAVREGAQWLVRQQVVPHLAWHTLVRATLIGAVVAWTVGMVPSTVLQLGGGPHTSTSPARSSLGVLATARGGVVGVVLTVPQWLVLRRDVRHAAWWLVANMGA